MKLSPSQIEYVTHYIASKDIKWYELQMELTDHLVMEMEQIWEQNPELSFQQVKAQAERTFGRNGFKEIEKERTQILRYQYKTQNLKMMVEYLKFPKIIGSILLGFLVYQGSFYFEKPHKYIGVLFVMLFLFLIPMAYQWLKNRKIDDKRFLECEFPNAPVLLVFPQLGMYLSNIFKVQIQQNHLLLIPFICLWVLGVLSCVTAIYLNNKIVARIKKQYQLN
jgi:hypothetical protein